MTPFAHIAGGYLATQIADLIDQKVYMNRPDMIIAAIIGANIPDFDMIFIKDKKQHRNTITHTPLFWIAVVIFICFINKFFPNPFISLYLFPFFLGLISHFLFDWFAARDNEIGGIRLFYPFSKKHYGFRHLKKLPPKLMSDFNYGKYLVFYMKDKLLFSIEVLIILSGAFIFFLRIQEYWNYFFK